MTATAAPGTTFNSSTDARVIGVLHVGSLTSRKFTDQRHGAAAIALQRSLLPSALPAVAWAELAARFIPGRGGVGGDWYDVFILPPVRRPGDRRCSPCRYRCRQCGRLAG